MMIEFFLRYIWVAFIAVTIVNALIFRARARRYIAEDPTLEPGYRTLFRGILFWCNLPWLTMGVGCLIGGVPSVVHFFSPRDGNPFVLAFWASLFVIWILGTLWVFALGGAEMVIRHPGTLSPDMSPALFKVFWCLCLTGGIVCAVVLFTVDVPIPNN